MFAMRGGAGAHFVYNAQVKNCVVIRREAGWIFDRVVKAAVNPKGEC